MQKNKECFVAKNRVAELFEAIFELKAKLKKCCKIDEIRVFAWL
ncbi:MAG: hypothetical protein SO164_02040 [Campylobacter sp.]|nr:hypothetical protein [Campylobacter sp.]